MSLTVWHRVRAAAARAVARKHEEPWPADMLARLNAATEQDREQLRKKRLRARVAPRTPGAAS